MKKKTIIPVPSQAEKDNSYKMTYAVVCTDLIACKIPSNVFATVCLLKTYVGVIPDQVVNTLHVTGMLKLLDKYGLVDIAYGEDGKKYITKVYDLPYEKYRGKSVDGGEPIPGKQAETKEGR